MEKIRANIEQNLTQNEPVELVPYKLNVYGPGGFFKGHVDTPTNSKKMIGTLVVALPSS